MYASERKINISKSAYILEELVFVKSHLIKKGFPEESTNGARSGLKTRLPDEKRYLLREGKSANVDRRFSKYPVPTRWLQQRYRCKKY